MTTAAMAGLPRVLVINSYHPSFPWVAAHNDALQWELRNTASLSFFNLDTKRISPAQYKAAADRAMQRIKIVDPKVVVLADDNALMLLGKRVMKRNIPVVFLGINSNPRKYMIEGGQITGVLERPLLKRSIVFIHDILPNKLKKCLVLFDDGTTSHVVLEDVFHGKQTLAFGGVLTNIRLIGSLHDWQHQVLSAQKEGYDTIIIGLYHTVMDDEGNNVPPRGTHPLDLCQQPRSPLRVLGFRRWQRQGHRRPGAFRQASGTQSRRVGPPHIGRGKSV